MKSSLARTRTFIVSIADIISLPLSWQNNDAERYIDLLVIIITERSNDNYIQLLNNSVK